MSLIKCPECGKDVSNLSEKCIHCGYPLQGQLKYKSYKVFKKEKEEKRKKELEEKQEKLRSTLHCPYCGSLDVRRNTGFIGRHRLFVPSASLGKNWKCKSCGSYF